ncbi:MAG: YciI family protein [Gammaproteobacteria bacterium]|nr:YciI family protein [Gammaproteobacteria bacterium]
MKYLALVYYDENIMKKMSQQEWDALNRECIDCVANLQTNGHFLAGAPLYTTDQARTVRVRDGKAMVTDGPFAETKEQLAGYYLLEATDQSEAVRLAQKIPPARYGSVEVRPIRDLLADENKL